MIRRFLLSIHKILGILLSVLFLMWFLSAFVMIFHTFPRATERDKIEKQQIISGNLHTIDSLLSQMPDTASIQSLSLDMLFDRPVFHLRGKGVPSDIYADSFQVPDENVDVNIARTAAQWCAAPVQRVDTMQKLDQWIPFGNLKKELPVYKYTFADKEKHELYISSKTGKVLQYTNREQRFWAWLGAIPHWVYFTSLRQNQTLWINFVKWTSGIGCIMCISGIILGIQTYRRTRRKGFKSPYKKSWYRWHYISGLFFGIFAVTFAFSGLMSLTGLPDWMMKKPKAQSEKTQQTPGKGGRGGPRNRGTIQLSAFKLDYRNIIENNNDIKNIEWAVYQKHSYYKVNTNEKTTYIDASDSLSIRPFVLTEQMIRQELNQIYGDSITYALELISEYDNEYYARRKHPAPLPVYRVIINDEMNTRYYFHPETLAQRRTDDNSRLRRLLYGGFHSLNFKFLTDRPVLWYIVMFTLLTGGTILSLTGVILSVKRIIKYVKKLILKKS